MEPLPPTLTADLFLPLHQELATLLRGLAPEQWLRPTRAGSWRVRDVAAHLLDVQLRRLSIARDGHRPQAQGPAPKSYDDVVTFLNRLNAAWVRAAQRLSPQVLLQLLEVSGPAVATVMTGLRPHDRAALAVSWAGEDQSENWMDVGREYTEWWHHQMQIRDAVGVPGLMSRRWLHPVLELSVRALPRVYAAVAAADGAAIVLEVAGEAGDVWSVVRGKRGGGRGDGSEWSVYRGAPAEASVRVRMEADAAWRLFFNQHTASAARARATVQGAAELAVPLFTARAVMV